MAAECSIFASLKSQKGTIISYYARPKSFTTGGVNKTNSEWLTVFSNFGISNVINVYMRDGLLPLEDQTENLSIRHIFNHRVFSIPIQYSFLKGKKSTLVYLHEGWTLSNFFIASYCLMNRINYAVMPHGVYEPGIIRTLKFWRVRKILEKFVLKHSKFVHIYFESEKLNVLAICNSAKLVVAPTGINAPYGCSRTWIGDGNYFLYAGRIDPLMKGLDLLVKSWKISRTSDKLILAGPDYNGGTEHIRELLAELGLEDEVLLVGNLPFKDLTALMKHARGFLHPSRWEASGRSPMDALCMGMPTLISDQMHISKVGPIANMAFISSLDPKEIANKIEQMSLTSPIEHRTKIESSFQEFRSYFEWKNVMDSLVNQI